MEKEDLKIGDKVTYCPEYGNKEHGIVKSFNDSKYKTIVFVVYHCNDEWSRYYDYTGAGTNLSDLKKGWI